MKCPYRKGNCPEYCVNSSFSGFEWECCEKIKAENEQYEREALKKKKKNQ